LGSISGIFAVAFISRKLFSFVRTVHNDTAVLEKNACLEAILGLFDL
jgi:hypothetical protein